MSKSKLLCIKVSFCLMVQSFIVLYFIFFSWGCASYDGYSILCFIYVFMCLCIYVFIIFIAGMLR